VQGDVIAVGQAELVALVPEYLWRNRDHQDDSKEMEPSGYKTSFAPGTLDGNMCQEGCPLRMRLDPQEATGSFFLQGNASFIDLEARSAAGIIGHTHM
jgi:hypothetical protein